MDTLFLTLPVSWRGILVRYAGRLHRAHLDKHEVRIVDYVDNNVAVLSRVFDKRRSGYVSMGYREDPKS
jgi:superfamily II DNA or RNA helicase